MAFPSPAADYAQFRLDVESYVVQHPVSTFYLRAESNTMRLDGITQGDVVVVDRSIKPCHGSLVIAILDGEFHLRRLCIRQGKASLISADHRIKPIPINDMDCQIFGVVTFSIKQHQA